MLRPNSWPIAILLVLGIVTAVFNVWTTAVRSTIPLHLKGTVTNRVMLIEKKAGVDDVFLVTFDGKREIQVDAAFFEKVYRGASVEKLAWKNEFLVDGRKETLEYSTDLRGMLVAMPVTIVVLILLLVPWFRQARK